MSSFALPGWEVVIGLETHVQLSTASKMFSDAPNLFGREPNMLASEVDLALPGTLPASLAGLPAMSVPAGFGRGEHARRPVGLQLVAPHFGEARLLHAAHQLQQVSDWHRRAPAL